MARENLGENVSTHDMLIKTALQRGWHQVSGYKHSVLQALLALLISRCLRQTKSEPVKLFLVVFLGHQCLGFEPTTHAGFHHG